MNIDKQIHGIVLQLPIPGDHNYFDQIVNSITPEKDLDCLNRKNYINMLY